MDVKKIRSLMPNINDMTYLNTGWSGPSPTYVVDAIKSRLEIESFNGPTSPEILESGQKIMSDSKMLVSKLFNCMPEEVVLTDNTTDGINLILNGLPWKPGDEVVLCDLEHPSVLLPAYNLQSSKGVRLRMVSIDLSSTFGGSGVLLGLPRFCFAIHFRTSSASPSWTLRPSTS